MTARASATIRPRNSKRVYKVDLAGAQDVSQTSGEAGLKPFALNKTLFLDVVQALTAHGYAATDIPAKLESLAFRPDVRVGGVLKHTQRGVCIDADPRFIVAPSSISIIGIPCGNTFSARSSLRCRAALLRKRWRHTRNNG